MTNFWWVRHGPTHLDRLIGWTDAPADLSDHNAISRLDAHLPDDAVIVSSDLQRCVTTADAISKNRARLAHDQNIREFHFGDWENNTYADVAKNDPELSRDYWTNPGDTAPPNGESWHEGRARMDASVDTLLKDHAGKHIVVVAHFGVILSQLQRATNMPAQSVLGFKIDNLSVTHIEHMGTAWRVLGVNHKP